MSFDITDILANRPELESPACDITLTRAIFIQTLNSMILQGEQFHLKTCSNFAPEVDPERKPNNTKQFGEQK